MVLGLAMAGLVVRVFACVFCHGVVLRIAIVRWCLEVHAGPRRKRSRRIKNTCLGAGMRIGPGGPRGGAAQGTVRKSMTSSTRPSRDGSRSA